MALSSVLFSVMYVLIRLAQGVDPLLLSLFRFAIGAVLVATLAIAGRIRLQFVDGRTLLLRGLLGGAAVYLSFLAIPTLGVARGSVISNAFPVFAAAGGAIFLKERVRPMAWIALGAAAAGLLAMRWGDPGNGGSTVWYVLATVGALTAGLAIVTVRKLTTTDSAHAIFLAQSAIGFWMVVVPAASRPAPLSLPVAGLLLAIGLIASMAQLLMTWSFARVDIATGSLLAMLTPLLNVVAGVALFGESLGAAGWVGVTLVIGACLLVLRR